MSHVNIDRLTEEKGICIEGRYSAVKVEVRCNFWVAQDHDGFFVSARVKTEIPWEFSKGGKG